MKISNLLSVMALLGMGAGVETCENILTLEQQKKSKYARPERTVYHDNNPPRPSKYPKKHPVAIELMAKAQAKRDRKNKTRILNDTLCFSGDYNRGVSL